MSIKHVASVLFALALAVGTSGCTATQPSGSGPSSAGQSSSAAPAQSGGSASSADLGQQIFMTGNGADGSPIGVSSGPGGPCARCHGADASGKVGPDIRWAVLTGQEPSPHAPRFPVSTEADFKTTVTTGVAAGNQLRPMMPRYQLTDAQVAALVAYLKSL